MNTGVVVARGQHQRFVLQCFYYMLITQTGLRAILNVEMIILVLQFIQILVFEILAGAQYTVQFCVGFFCCILWAVIIAVTWYGAQNHNHNLIVPHIILSVSNHVLLHNI